MILQPMGRKGRAPAHVRAWTPEEDALLIALYPSTPVKDIAVRIKRSFWGVHNRIVLLRGTYPDYGMLNHHGVLPLGKSARNLNYPRAR